MTPWDDAAPALLHQDEGTCITRTSTRLDAMSARDCTAYPLAVTIIEPAIHALHAAASYRLAAVCDCCGAALVHPISVARRLGPVCAARLARAA